MRQAGPAISVVIGFLMSLPASSVQGQVQPVSARSTPDLTPVRSVSAGLVVEVDPRIELMAAIQLLADYPVLTAHDTPYKADVESWFRPYREHDVIREFATMYAAGFAFDAVPKAFASMGPVPHLGLGPVVPSEAVERAGGRETLERFTRMAADFASRADMQSFYRAHAGTYRVLVDAAMPEVESAVAQLVAYTGVDFPSARIVLSPLLHDGGFAMSGGDPPAQAFVGPVGVGENGFPDFGDRRRLGRLIWHEFAHTIINPLTGRARATVDALEVTDDEFRARMRRHAYDDWHTIVSESIIRALEVRLTAQALGPDAAGSAEASQVDRGFIHVPALARTLRAYEAERDRYPAIADFYPRLLQVFEGRTGP